MPAPPLVASPSPQIHVRSTPPPLPFCKQPRGVTCTTDREDKANIVSAGGFQAFPQRLFPVGRLDKESTGLILLTSDGRLPDSLLRPQVKRPKTYAVELTARPTDAQVASLAAGVVITTTAQRAHAKPQTARTLPCRVERTGGSDSR